LKVLRVLKTVYEMGLNICHDTSEFLSYQELLGAVLRCWGASKTNRAEKYAIRRRDVCVLGRQIVISCRNVHKVSIYPTRSSKVRKNIILPVVLYGYETWSLTLRKEHRLRVFENRVMRRIFGPKRDEATGEWRKLHNEELRDLYSSPSIIRIIRSRRMLGGACSTNGGKPERKRPLGRPRST
jgi:hypothetical protein